MTAGTDGPSTPPPLDDEDEVGCGGAGASVAVRAATSVVTGDGVDGAPGRLIGDGPVPPAGPTARRSLRRPRNGMRTGSYFVSTTRSLSGMIPLSVMWMPSGHTSVQHLVMLQ